jgi:hypothetical protein
MESYRSAKEINEVGFRALVDALGRDDAIRFLRQFSPVPGGPAAAAASDAAADTLPPMSLEEAHERIRDLQDPRDQASLL